MDTDVNRGITTLDKRTYSVRKDEVRRVQKEVANVAPRNKGRLRSSPGAAHKTRTRFLPFQNTYCNILTALADEERHIAFTAEVRAWGDQAA